MNNKILTVAIRLAIAEPRYAQKNATREMREESLVAEHTDSGSYMTGII